MCEKCDEAWAKYKKAEMIYVEAKKVYIKQSKEDCDEKKDSKSPEESKPQKPMTELQTLMDQNGFCESQTKTGLWFKKLGEDHVVFIDLRNGPARAYGMKNGENMPHEDVSKETKPVTETLKANERKKAGQTGLDEKFF